MTRPLDGEIRLTGRLVTRTPLQVAGLERDPSVDIGLYRDERGRLCLPGTSLAGAVREACRRRFGEALEIELWGTVDDRGGVASRILVEDAPVVGGGALPELRDGVGIDRAWGTAAERFKYDRLVLPRGTAFTLTIAGSFPDAAAHARGLAWFWALRTMLEGGALRLGASVTRGLGRVALEEGRLEARHLRGPEDVLARLVGAGGGWTPVAEAPDVTLPRADDPGRVGIEIAWQPITPTFVRAALEAGHYDTLPLSGRDGGAVRLVLPGSSIKGALRAQAERIVATLAGTGGVWDAPDEDPRTRFLDGIDQWPIVNALFGARGRPTPCGAEKAAGPRPGRGALAVDDCYAETEFDAAQWQRVTQGEAGDRERGDSAMPHDRRRFRFSQHVAIDRWTGGAAESLLYNVLDPVDIAWDPIHLDLDLARIEEVDRPVALALLLLVLRDMAEGLVPLGFARNRGRGAIRVTGVGLAGLTALGAGEDAARWSGSGDDLLASLPADLRGVLEAAWRDGRAVVPAADGEGDR